MDLDHRWKWVTITLDSSRIAITVENGVVTLRMEDDQAQALLRKYVTTDPYAKRNCSSVAEVAERYGFSEKVVRSWLEKGCPFFRVASDIRLDDKEVDEWFADKFGRNLNTSQANTNLGRSKWAA